MPSFIEDMTAATEKLGPQPVGVIFGVALANWESAEQRDSFLNILTSNSNQRG